MGQLRLGEFGCTRHPSVCTRGDSGGLHMVIIAVFGSGNHH